MSNIKVYRRKSKNDMESGTSMEKRKKTEFAEVQYNWVPETPDHKGEPAHFAVKSPEGDFSLEEKCNSLGDAKACTSDVARRLDFSTCGDSNKGLGDAYAVPPSFQECRTATTSSTGDGQKDMQIDFIFVVENEKLHGEHLELGTPLKQHLEPGTPLKQHLEPVNLLKQHLEPVTPLKQHLEPDLKRSRNGIDVNQRALKRPKIKKHRHRPKVAVEGRKRRVKRQEKSKYANKTQYKEKVKVKRKYVRKSSKTSNTEHHTESVAANSSSFSLANQPNENNCMELLQPKASAVPETTITRDQEIYDRTMQLTVSVVSKLVASHSSYDNMDGNVGGQNLLAQLNLEMNSFRWGSRGKRSIWTYCKNSYVRNNIGCQYKNSRGHKEFKVNCCLCKSRKAGPNFPRKSIRIKKQMKSKMSILPSFLELHNHAKRKRCKRIVQKRNWAPLATISMFNHQNIPLKDPQNSLQGKTLMGEASQNSLQGKTLIGEAPQNSFQGKILIGEAPQNSFQGKTLMGESKEVPERLILSHIEQFHSGEEQGESDQEKCPKKGFKGTKVKNLRIDDVICKFNLLKINDIGAIVPYQDSVPTNTKGSRVKVKDLRMHKLVFEEDGLPDGTELAYYNRKEKLLVGHKKGFGIFCSCCKKEVSPSQFEAHAGWPSRRKPYMHIYTSNGLSLHELAILLSRSGKSFTQGNNLCHICRDGGQLLKCDVCPRAYHKECLVLLEIPNGKRYCKICMNNFQNKKFVEQNANAIASGVDPTDQITRQCTSVKAEFGGRVSRRGHEFDKNYGSHMVSPCDKSKDLQVNCLKDQNVMTIVPHRGSRSKKSKAQLLPEDQNMKAITPVGGSSRKGKSRPQVLLDEGTIRQNLLMKVGKSLGGEKEDKEGQKKFEKEVEIFSGRIRSFTSRMHVILGDRGFKPWKGSVVDSVVGVYLTQNVSDYLSSSAYMELASKFPVQSTGNQEASDDELDYDYSQESIGDNIVSTGTSQDSSENGYFVTEPEPEPKTPIDIVEEINLEGTNPRSGSEGLDSLKPTSEMLCSSSRVCHNSNNFHSMEDYQAENVVEQNVSPGMGNLPQDCSSQQEVGVESNLHAQSVHNDRQLIVLEEMVYQSSALVLASGEKRKTTRGKKNVVEKEEKDWKIIGINNSRQRRRAETDSVDWEAVRQAPVNEIADLIQQRGQQNVIAGKIKKFLDGIVECHGSIDLEWLRHARNDDVKDYLLEIHGIGLKSVECLRLLTLKHVAFPVDVNVARIAVRLGWVPLEPLPGDLQLHLLEEYPILDTIQKYLWPRLCNLGQRTLYELHYQMITFGKVFCTKRKPNCGVCPMRAECRHLASKIASENLCLPGPLKKGEERSKIRSISLINSAVVGNDALIANPTIVSLSESTITSESEFRAQACEPLIEEPKSPELVDDIEDFGMDEYIIGDDEEIPTIKLNDKPFRENVQYFMDKYWNDSLSRALVPLSVNVDSVPAHKLKNITRLRTEHQVYEIPDGHELLIGLRKRDRHDQSPYLLAIWTSVETQGSSPPPVKTCHSQGSQLCNDQTSSFCQTVPGTILVPCRTAMRGRFPLNGTYFQVNEVFADHESSYNPITVTRSSIWHLKTRTVYCGTSPHTIFKACSLKEIQENFWRGFICVRGWDAKTGAPKPLAKRFHCPPSKIEKTPRKKGVNASSKDDAKGTASMSNSAA